MIITIEGPTAAGKSAIALQLAKALNTDIVNCDSRQIYKYMDIGTAKPSVAERQAVSHHLIDIITPDQSYNAGLFARDADAIIRTLKDQGKIPIICGGTGLYVKVLLEGLFQHPPHDPALREELHQELVEKGIAHMYQLLSEIDPDFAQNVSANDPQRILRGLEVYRATGKSISQHWAQQKRESRYQAYRILINPPRQSLYEKINLRLGSMLKSGLIDEIEGLLQQCYKWTDPGLNSLGYKEFKAYFEGEVSLAEAGEKAAQHHRNYAKRQLTWYRKQRFDLATEPQSFNLSDVIRTIQA
ncbi:MAG: tRNA (adenosine(37)-N6)-dimethylallyltransferase MiaA [Candidatus Cloacimonadaceae bacterium]|jgi:tRNA dimethylallyltransferase|nr:tRNA (adenosine(37)-N6)-dimethylallyltransferase MiaA [Candidatus Cloacimonadota bacterium]MDY0126514.1 tRNA (adenosine(37)-N6)-dimethylallyltransferase MiaA [Candidatus Cloacimonadaceae bacterium]MCB5255403.1 tRNA (adenosine(37)-N6)-dimethylallyltransferase MiaA [Candidatus Cloacimonadota bacterium]MCK9177552.1 tRNA (adenosine(37)-N6)-dimethylallyltransferase MiaA [Candidatus Cloacimonadota bacterium]MCK9242208.1 tRNA (adenosine(37)-N6)-dimethylallyltransferase MiaA [Candidatus Cloacimonado